MPIRRRHGLRTVALSAAGSAGPVRRLTCLRGRKTVILRPLLGPDGSTDPIERPGELMLAVDHAGRSVAVLRVERAGVAALADIDEVLCRADDPDVEGHAAWSAARRQEWLAAGVSVDDDAAVVWVRFHVVGGDQGPG